MDQFLFETLVLTSATGALLDEQPKEGEALKINGSCFIAHAATKDEVMVELKNDVYAKGEVWDFEKVCSTRESQELADFIDSNSAIQASFHQVVKLRTNNHG